MIVLNKKSWLVKDILAIISFNFTEFVGNEIQSFYTDFGGCKRTI